MASISGVFIHDGQPKDGASAKLWPAASFGSPPVKNTALPGSGQIGPTVTTGPSHGFNGAYRFTGISGGDYYVSLEWAGSIGWSGVSVPDTMTGYQLTSQKGAISGYVGIDATGKADIPARDATNLGGAIILQGPGALPDWSIEQTGADLRIVRGGTVLYTFTPVSFIASIGDNTSIELRATLGGTPFIDFSNDTSIDFDARIVLTGNDELQVQGAVLYAVAGLRQNGNLGFYGVAPIAKPTVTGSKAANAALTSLLTALANLGIVTNSTT